MKTQFLLLAALALSACSDDNKDKAENTLRVPELNSEWRGACEDAGILPVSASSAFNFESLNFTRTMFGSADGSCATQDIVITYKGEYSVSAQNDAQKKISAYPIDLSYKSVVVKPLTEEGVNRLNGIAFGIGAFCGVTDWAVNVERDLTAKSTETGCALSDLPQIQYDIISTEGGILRFGATTVVNDAPTKVEERPVEFKGVTLNKN